jgi:uncharacterized protein
MTEATNSQSNASTKAPGAPRYRLIDGDTHINEPPDLWTSRIEKKFVDRVPHMEHFDEGDAWVIEGVDDPISFGLNACAGTPPSEQKPWIRFEDLRRGGYDPVARLSEMDIDRIDGAFLYPTPRLTQGVVTNKDPELQVAMVRAYNDWLSEYATVDPTRLFGLAILPICGVKEAVAEYERILTLPGMKGATILCYPHGTAEIDESDDALFAAVAASGLPLNIHHQLNANPPSLHKFKLAAEPRFNDAPKRMLEFIFTGVFDRFPELMVGFIEVDAGWVPFCKEQFDNRYHRTATAFHLEMDGPPSEYIDRHCFFTYISDTYAVDNRHAVGVENMLWSSDYPHVGSDWPHSWRTIDAAFSGVPADEKALILWGNAARLYGI